MNLTHVHLVLNHVPIVLTFVGLALLLAAALRRSTELRTAGLLMFLLSAMVAVAVYLTGEPAEESVEHMPGVTHAIIERHEDAAGFALASVVVLGAASTIALGLGLTKLTARPNVARAVLGLPLLISVAAGALLLWTAKLGGEVRHTEIRGSLFDTGSAAHDRD